jgi:hypothetical protein
MFPDHLTGRHILPYASTALQNNTVRHEDRQAKNAMSWLAVLPHSPPPQFTLFGAGSSDVGYRTDIRSLTQPLRTGRSGASRVVRKSELIMLMAKYIRSVFGR